MSRVLEILNEIDDEWDAPARLSHQYHMELLTDVVNEPFSIDYSHNLSVFFAEC